MLSCIISSCNSCFYSSSFSCCNRLGAGSNGVSLCAGSGNNFFSLGLCLVHHCIGSGGVNSSLRLCSDLNGLCSLRNCFCNSSGFVIIKGGAWQQTCALTDLSYRFFPLNGHDMDTSHAFYLFYLVDNINADIDSFLLLVLSTLHPVDDLIGHVHTRHEFFHVARHAQRLGRGNTGKDICLFR